jgi:hypothetical protein
MKVHKLEAHDRLQHMKKDQSFNIFQGAEDCLKKNKLSLSLQEKSSYIYMFAHPRTMDDGVTKAMYWQPRLSKPTPQDNSYLFRVKSKTDEIEVCWLIPPRDMWPEYAPGQMHHTQEIWWSIQQYRNNREKLGEKDPDDMPEQQGKNILRQIFNEHDQQQHKKKLILQGPTRQVILES